MKNFIYISGLASVNLLMFGALFKIMHWPGAGIMLVFAFAILIAVFLPSALINNYRNNYSDRSPMLHIVVYLVCVVEFVAALFKIMHWPGASLLLIFGIPAPFVVFLPVFLYQHNKRHKKPNFNFFAVMFLFVYIAVFSALLALQPSKNVADNGVVLGEQNENAYRALKQANMQKHNSQLSKLHDRTDQLCATISTIKADLLELSGTKTTGNEDVPLIFVKNKMDDSAVRAYLCSHDGKSITFEQLKQEIEDYRTYALTIIPDNQLGQKDFVDEILSTSKLVYVPQHRVGPDKVNLGKSTLIMALNHLTRLQTEVRLVEQEVVFSATNKFAR